jgi:hypothetical protein
MAAREAREVSGSIPLWGERLTTPETTMKLNRVAPPLRVPSGHDKGKDHVNWHENRNQLDA